MKELKRSGLGVNHFLKYVEPTRMCLGGQHADSVHDVEERPRKGRPMYYLPWKENCSKNKIRTLVHRFDLNISVGIAVLSCFPGDICFFCLDGNCIIFLETHTAKIISVWLSYFSSFGNGYRNWVYDMQTIKNSCYAVF